MNLVVLQHDTPYTVDELASRTGVAAMTIQEAVASGTLPSEHGRVKGIYFGKWVQDQSTELASATVIHERSKPIDAYL